MIDMSLSWDNTCVPPRPQYEMFTNQAPQKRLSNESTITETLLYVAGYDSYSRGISIPADGEWTNQNIVSIKSSSKAENIASFARKLKVFLGLSNKDIGVLYGVTRQSVQTYLKSDTGANKANDEVISRAFDVDRVLIKISSLFKYSPGALVKSVKVDGVSLFDALSDSVIDSSKVEGIAKKLGEIMEHSDIGINALNEATVLSSITRHT